MLDAKALQRSQIVAIAEFPKKVLQDSPIAIAGVTSVGAFEMVFQILLYAVVVEQRVVDVDQEDDRIEAVPFRTPATFVVFAVRLTRSPPQ